MKLFEKFSWAVPLAFADALNICRFEEGDLLYDSPKAYDGEWAEGKKHVRHYVQIVNPPRSSNRGTMDSGQLFESNWLSELQLDLCFLDGRKSERIETTQGRLYAAWWKGDLEILNPATPEPEAPTGVRSVNRLLSKVDLHGISVPLTFPAFVMPLDLSNPVSREKFSKVQTVLGNDLTAEPNILSPEQSGFTEWDTFAPTIDIAFFETPELPSAELFEKVKSVVYKPNPKAKTQRFSMAAHGVILEA